MKNLFRASGQMFLIPALGSLRDPTASSKPVCAALFCLRKTKGKKGEKIKRKGGTKGILLK